MNKGHLASETAFPSFLASQKQSSDVGPRVAHGTPPLATSWIATDTSFAAR